MKNNRGQSLLEVIIAMSVSVVLVSGLVFSVTTAIRNSQFAKNQTLATKFAQEGMEWMRSYRDQAPGWNNLYGKAATSPGNTYCLNNLPTWPGVGSCSATSFLGSTIFKREAILKTIPGDLDKIQVTVTVSWTDPMGTHQSQLTSYFSNQSVWNRAIPTPTPGPTSTPTPTPTSTPTPTPTPSLYANGHSCSSPGQCTSGWCVGGTCCNSACTATRGLCQTGGGCSTGTCVAVSNAAAGTDPNNDCTATGPVVYLNSATGVTCATVCSGHTTLPGTCNGSGVCSGAQAASCVNQGTDSAGTNGLAYYWSGGGGGGSCDLLSVYQWCSVRMWSDYGETCSGNVEMWTNCRCQ